LKYAKYAAIFLEDGGIKFILPRGLGELLKKVPFCGIYAKIASTVKYKLREANMFDTFKSGDREQNYIRMLEAVSALLTDESDEIAGLAMISSIIFFYMDDVNWVGFYILKDNCLVLGPFQGKPACLRIMPGKGVCGAAVLSGRVITVDDVHKFDGHIACDVDTNSEITLPIYKNGEVYGVLDIDSPIASRFGELECTYLGPAAEALTKFLSN
jgi:GAF domain-containing protein